MTGFLSSLFALYQVYNSHYTLGLTPFEIFYVRLPPILSNHRTELLTKFNDQKFLSSLHVWSQVQKQLWPQLCIVYEKALPLVPHRLWPGDLVTNKEHKKGDFEACLEGTLQCHPDNAQSCQSGWNSHFNSPFTIPTWNPLTQTLILRTTIQRKSTLNFRESLYIHETL